MANISKWSNVGVTVQSALATADTITGITKANPGVVTSAAHGLSNGNYVVLSVTGMHQLDGRVVRVANVATNTFELEGVDTSSFDTFSAGTAEAITFGTTLTTATNLSASGGDFDFLDITTIHDSIKKQVPGLANPSTFAFESIWDAADTGLIALKAASDSQARRCVKCVFANGQIIVFSGYVAASMLPTGSAQEVVKTSVTLTVFGYMTVYSS